MDKESKPGGGAFPSNGIVAVVLLVAGALFVREAPLQNTRPASNEARLERRDTGGTKAEQNVEARLWQDPLGAVAKFRAELLKTSKDKLEAEDKRHLSKPLVDQVAEKERTYKRKPQVFAVLMTGGSYSENVESRRRERYAVLAALDASRLSPADTEHLGYILPVFKQGSAAEAPLPVPYEWFDPATDDEGADAATPPVLVLWISGELLGEKPLRRIQDFIDEFRDGHAMWRVLGPSSSDGLKAMIDEVDEGTGIQRLNPEQVRIYSLYATVPSTVVGRSTNENLPCRGKMDDCLANKLSMVRTLGDDAGLARALIDELKLRGLLAYKRTGDAKLSFEAFCKTRELQDVPSQIAVVAEWDTVYGRNFRSQFMPTPEQAGFCVDSFNYVRGLDGQAAEANSAGAKEGGAAKQDGAGKDESRRNDGTFIEVAEGQSQFDYLRRLAIQMRNRDRMLRRNSADGQGFRAIGILGSDVHDKLLVMQALRADFPDAIFFTTDLDARLLHPREQAWARNLIVASNFGLRLTGALQGSVPPFRDSYQTSAFLATRLAMNDALHAAKPDLYAEVPVEWIQHWFHSARIFEIGRTMAFDYTGRARSKGLEPGVTCLAQALAKCNDIHPAGSALYPTPRRLAVAVILSVLILLIWLPPVCAARRAKRYLAQLVMDVGRSGKRLVPFAVCVFGFVALQFVIPWELAGQWKPFAARITDGGEPMLAIEGISMWPSEGLRIATLLLSCCLIHRGWLMLSYSLMDINEEFKSKGMRTRLEARQNKVDQGTTRWCRVAQMFWMACIPPLHKQVPQFARRGMRDEAIDLWGQHVVQDRFRARLARAFTFAGLSALLTFLLLAVVGDDTFLPGRGSWAIAVHGKLGGCCNHRHVLSAVLRGGRDGAQRAFHSRPEAPAWSGR
ncbi:hypothetical protein ACFJGW_12330 [Burkholderiaceae bacterium UC74_6]